MIICLKDENKKEEASSGFFTTIVDAITSKFS
jgi:hypothetical protein